MAAGNIEDLCQMTYYLLKITYYLVGIFQRCTKLSLLFVNN